MPTANGLSRLRHAYPCVVGTMEYFSRPLEASIRGWGGYCRRATGCEVGPSAEAREDGFHGYMGYYDITEGVCGLTFMPILSTDDVLPL